MAEGTLNRAVSKDGTEIGYFTGGEGPPLLLIHGGLGDHTRWDILRPYLEPHMTVHAIDRRGRGASGDHPNYDLAREFEDIAEVTDLVAEASGSPVDIYAHSAGGIYTVGAAPLTSSIRKLVIYEGWDWMNPEAYVPPLNVLKQMDTLIAEGNREGACELLFRKVLGVSEEDLEKYRAQPSWQSRVDIVHTVSREVQSFLKNRFNPSQLDSITNPTMLLVGSESPAGWKSDAERLVGMLPNARVTILDGQEHLADALAPELVTSKLLPFLLE